MNSKANSPPLKEPVWNPQTKLWEGEAIESSNPSMLKMIDISGRGFCNRGCGRPIVFGTHPQTGKRITADPITHQRHICNANDIRRQLEYELRMQPIRHRVATASYADVVRTHSDLYHKQRNGGPPLTEREEMYFAACDARIKQTEGNNEWLAQL